MGNNGHKLTSLGAVVTSLCFATFQVRTYRVQNFCKCDVCTHVDGLLAAMPRGAELSTRARHNREWFQGMKRGHLAYVAHCRERLRIRAEYARTHTREVLFVNLDGMDQ